MKKTKIIIPMLLAGMILQGCASVGNQSMKKQDSKTVSAKILKGTTKEYQVVAEFGVPLETSFTNEGNKIFTYVYDDASAFTPETVGSVLFTLGLAGSKTRGERRELTILFDENDIVKNYTVHISQVEGGTMLFK